MPELAYCLLFAVFAIAALCIAAPTTSPIARPLGIAPAMTMNCRPTSRAVRSRGTPSRRSSRGKNARIPINCDWTRMTHRPRAGHGPEAIPKRGTAAGVTNDHARLPRSRRRLRARGARPVLRRCPLGHLSLSLLPTPHAGRGTLTTTPGRVASARRLHGRRRSLHTHSAAWPNREADDSRERPALRACGRANRQRASSVATSLLAEPLRAAQRRVRIPEGPL